MAVAGVSFSVRRGEVFALLGPNGAGKTTTVEILEGYRKPTAGRVSVLGHDPVRDGASLKPRIGVMLQGEGLYLTITPREALRLWARFYPRSRDADDLLSLVGLQDAAGMRYRRLSGGQKKRLALALALVGNPDMVFLDEPTAGLDPQARRATWDIVRSLQEGGATVILATHYLEEAERLADRVGILRAGTLAAYGRLSDLLPAEQSVRVTAAETVPLDLYRSVPSATGVVQDSNGTAILGTSDPGATVAEVAARLRDAGIIPREIVVGRRSLEDLFFDLTQGTEGA
jgi:ABC-2 type transport system ATP-binding protein